jgi:hypothetical protein
MSDVFFPRPRLVYSDRSPPKDARPPLTLLSADSYSGYRTNVLCITFKSRVEALRDPRQLAREGR